jgi:hypothetical protein
VLVTIAATAVGCSTATPSPQSRGTESPSASGRVDDKSIGHVFVINLENKGYDETWGPSSPASYLVQTLRPKGELLTQYYGIGHNSLDNYIAQISGQAPNQATQADCPQFIEFQQSGVGEYGQANGSGCVYPPAVSTVADQLNAHGKTWKTYQQDMASSPTEPKTCRHPAIGATDQTLIARPGDMYATRHNPFVYFHSIIDSPKCQEAVTDLGELDRDLASVEATPNLAYITPNLCNDGHDTPCVDGQPGGLVSADRFLAEQVPPILASSAYLADGLLIITFDESEASDSTSCCEIPPSPNSAQPGINGPGGGHIGALLLSPSLAPNTHDDTPYNHYSLLCSVEDIFGLERLGFAAAPGLQCFA